MRKYHILAAITLITCVMSMQALATTTLPEDKSSAVILAYHRIGEETYPDTNLRIDQFEEHIRALKSERYTVLPLMEIINSIQSEQPLPPRTLAITFEGAYKSAFKNAMPLLIKNDIPFTVFFASDQADANLPPNMNWKDLISLTRYKNIDFGMHPAPYARLAGNSSEDILTQINRARVRFRDHLGIEPKLFSYPFGEYSLAYKKLIEKQGFTAALGLQSGSVSKSSDFYALPRFSMTEIYGDIERFQLVSSALPFPVTDIEPEDPYLSASINQLGFSIPAALAQDAADLSCYLSGQPQPTIEFLGDSRVELSFTEPITSPRTRLNCTLPAPGEDDTPNWRWFSVLFVNGETDSEIQP